MNERYAIDPDAAANADELKLLLDKLGMQTGRFLAKYPDDWTQFLLDRFAAAPPVERKRVVHLLARHKIFALGCGGKSFQRTKTWPENAVAVKSVSPKTFDAIVAPIGNAFGLPTPRDVLYEDHHAWPDGRGDHVSMKAVSYARLAEPLFELSPEVFLVDAYFALRSPTGTPHSRQRRVLQALLKEASKSPICQSIRLILKKSTIGESATNEAALEQDLDKLIFVLDKKEINLEYQILDDVGHGRYLFSIHGGLQFDHGFDEHEANKNHVHWLSEPELSPLLVKFGANSEKWCKSNVER